jgi:hypothetical protein
MEAQPNQRNADGEPWYLYDGRHRVAATPPLKIWSVLILR